ncbi:hypothetical protein ACVIHC_000051 [Bradyrhizobium diazoefficiens]
MCEVPVEPMAGAKNWAVLIAKVVNWSHKLDIVCQTGLDARQHIVDRRSKTLSFGLLQRGAWSRRSVT